MRRWIPARAITRAVLLIIVLLLGAVVLGRPDVVVLAVPFVIGTTLAMWKRPIGTPIVSMVTGAGRSTGPTPPTRSTQPTRLQEGDVLTAGLEVTNPDDSTYDVALIGIPEADGIALDRAGRTVAVPIQPGSKTTVSLEVDLLRWGRRTIDPVELRAISGGGLLLGPSIRSDPLALKIYPHSTEFEADDAMPNAAGMVGVHPSRRYGDGGALADIRRFVPGDRLRRIEWRTSLRSRELHVVQTYSDRDAELAIVLDLLHDAGRSPSVLDQAVRATAGIVEHYTGRGDRVKLVEYGGRGRTLRGGTGPRHRALTLEWLLDVRAGERRFGPSDVPTGRSLISERSLVVVLTPFLDDRSVAMLAGMARSRRSVIAVDTLPTHLDAESVGRQGQWTDVAFRLWMLNRRNTMDRLVSIGVPVVRWAGAGSFDQVLRGLSRMAASR